MLNVSTAEHIKKDLGIQVARFRAVDIARIKSSIVTDMSEISFTIPEKYENRPISKVEVIDGVTVYFIEFSAIEFYKLGLTYYPYWIVKN